MDDSINDTNENILNEYSLLKLGDKEFTKKFFLTNDISIRIFSNVQECLMEDYFSVKSIGDSLKSSNYDIYIIDQEFNDIDIRVKEICKNSSLRSKRITNGYYNMHHFGSPACLYIDYEKKRVYILGTLKSCKKIFWSYVIKWILTQETLLKRIHLKGSLLQLGGKGYLIIGGKSSGKSTLIYNLMKKNRNSKFISNTHVLIDKEGIAEGIKSNINFRKNMALKICYENEKLRNKKILGCTNLDPIDLNYEISDKCKVDTIVFYQYNCQNKYTRNGIQKSDMRNLIEMYSNAINVYSLKEDLLDYRQFNIKKVCDDIKSQKECLATIVEHTKNIGITCDCENERCLENICDYFNY